MTQIKIIIGIISLITLILFTACNIDVKIATDYCHSQNYKYYHVEFNKETKLIKCYNNETDYINVSKNISIILEEIKSLNNKHLKGL